MFLLLALSAFITCHNDEYLFLKKYEGEGCVGNITQYAITELDHCVPTIYPLTGQRISVRYNWEGSAMKLHAYLFHSNCEDREVSVKTKDINTDGVTCVEDNFRYEVVGAEKVHEFLPAEFGAYVEMHEEFECVGTTYRWEYFKGWGGYCDGTKNDDRCENRDGYSVEVECNKPDVKILEIEKEIEVERKRNLIFVIVGLLAVGMVIVVCFLIALAVVILAIVYIVRMKKKPKKKLRKKRKKRKKKKKQPKSSVESTDDSLDDPITTEDESFTTEQSMDDDLKNSYDSTFDEEMESDLLDELEIDL